MALAHEAQLYLCRNCVIGIDGPDAAESDIATYGFIGTWLPAMWGAGV